MKKKIYCSVEQVIELARDSFIERDRLCLSYDQLFQ